MDGGITRQSEQYGIFADRPRPRGVDRTAREVPESVVHEYTRGPSVGAGQLNPRGIRRQHFAGFGEGPAVPESYWYDDEDEERRRYNTEELGLNREPPEDPYGGIAPETPLQPLDQMLEYSRRPDPMDPRSRLGFNRRGQGLMTHMFVPGSRVGLPYGNDVIQGIVHQLHPDSEVGVRWEDGQYTKESPGDVYPL